MKAIIYLLSVVHADEVAGYVLCYTRLKETNVLSVHMKYMEVPPKLILIFGHTVSLIDETALY